ncbi:bioproteinsis of lysosomal organelles complex-1, subunit 4, cappuccino [Chamberlinius hualienensis]
MNISQTPEEIGMEAEMLSETKIAEENLKDLSQAYANYMAVDVKKEKVKLSEATDELLTKLEEFLAVIELTRNDNINCLDKILPKIVAKYEQLQPVFQRIDNLEMLVNIVKEKVNTLNSMVTESEKRMLPENSLSKLLTPLFSRKDAQPLLSQDIQVELPCPVTFQAKDYISSIRSPDNQS